MLMRLLAVALVFLAGCATTAPAVPIESTRIAKGSKVGVVVRVSDAGQHGHIGTTVFNNFSKPYDFPWSQSARIYDTLSSDLTSAGFQVVRLTDLSPEALNKLAIVQDARWVENPAQAATAQRLREQQISAVVLVESKRTLALLECTGGPCSERYMSESGLFTRSFLGLTQYIAVPAFETRVFMLTPVAELSAYDPVKSTQANRGFRLQGFQAPQDFKNLTSAEFAPVAAQIDTYIKTLSQATTNAMVSGVK